MKTKHALFTALLSALLAPLLAAEQKVARPNIVLIFADDFGYGDPGVHPHGSEIEMTVQRNTLAASLLLAILGTEIAAAEKASRPNIVIVLADNMGWRDTGYHGNTVVNTPHLDEMARRGVQFDYFYPGQQMCSPGRFAVMTGRKP